MLGRAFALTRHVWPSDRYLWPAAQIVSRVRGLSHELRTYRTARGFQMGLEPFAHPDGAMLYGTYEVATMRWLKRTIQPGDVVADVGANIGYHALTLSRLVGGCGRVIAFEPNPPAVWRLRANLSLNGVLNVEVIESAVGDTDAETQLFRPVRDWHGHPSLHRHSDEWVSVGCRVSRLDTIFADLPRLDLLKMDIEGAEPAALRGAASTIRRLRPKIVLERHDERLAAFGSSFSEVKEILAAFGYRTARVLDASRDHANVAFEPCRSRA